MRALRLVEIELVAFEMAKRLFPFNEPIPNFATRYKNVLESCIATPFQKFGGKYLYKGLIGKAAMLFYLMIKNHPFQNGNKRVAVMALLYFLFVNKRWLSVDGRKLYGFALDVAKSDRENRKEQVKKIEFFIKYHWKKLK